MVPQLPKNKTASRLVQFPEWSCSWAETPNDGWKTVVRCARRFEAQILLAWKGTTVDAKQINPHGCPTITLEDEILVQTSGADALQAVDAVASIIDTFDFRWHEMMNVAKDSATVTIVNAGGVHERPALRIAVCAKGFRSLIGIGDSGGVADAKSIMAVSSLALTYGTEVHVRAIGDDATLGVGALVKVIASGFGEI